MSTRKKDLETVDRAEPQPPQMQTLDPRETLLCVAKLARLIATISHGTAALDPGNESSTEKPERSVVDRTIEAATRSMPETPDDMAATPLSAIEVTFEELRKAIPEIRDKSAAVLGEVLKPSELEDKLDEIVQPIEYRLLQVAWLSSELSCETPRDVLIKAKVLKHIAHDDPDDVESALTLSLCDDILAGNLSSGHSGAPSSAPSSARSSAKASVDREAAIVDLEDDPAK